MKKSYLVLALLVLVWLFSSCDNLATQEPQPSTSFASSAPTKTATAITPTSEVAVPSPETSTNSVDTISPQALAVAQGLQVRGRAPDTDYSRDAFGSAWRDVDGNGCDTRNDILQRDFATSILKAGTGNCKVFGGTWTDPYSNESYSFDEAPSGAQIDHVVSLKNAWQMGADQWSEEMRVEFANDPLNLRVTIASLNQQKSDSNAASWLPPFKPGRCNFIATQVAVKAKWNLYVTESEKEVFVAILGKPECQETKLPK
ncbi:MAG: hypothetical protein RL289_159 [Actinomycetota bacterium]